MKEIIKFLEKNSKWVVRFLVLVGIFLIIKLWMIGLFISPSCGGQWINLCFGFDVEYFWINSGYIAIIFFIVSIFLITKINKTKNNIKKIQIAFLIFLLGIIGKPMFFLVSPDFKFYLTPVTKQYKNINNELIDIDSYLELTTKYCDNFKSGDNFNYRYSRETMCSGKFEPDLKTVEEYIKVLDYANEHSFKYLYGTTYRWADDNVGLDNLIEQYNDDTFYAYVIYNGGLLKEKRDKLKTYITNNKILDVLDFYNKSIIENKTLMSDDKYHSADKYWKNFDIEIKKQIKQIPEVNNKLF